MYHQVAYQGHKDHPKRPIWISGILRSVILVTVCSVTVVPRQQTFSQERPQKNEATASLCKRNNAVDTIRQQIGQASVLDSPVQRIAVLIRAADLLWAFQQDKARGALTEAFELAVQHEKEKTQQPINSRSLLMEIPDQRYVVIRAVAKRDSAWAKRLTQLALRPDRSGDDSSTRSSLNDVLTAQKLLDSANQLIATDLNAAWELAGASLHYPASFMIAKFLYNLAAVNQHMADQFYDQALAVYADRPMREFLYLATYPFAFRSSGDTPVFGFYSNVPAGFLTNKSLQRRFVQTLLLRAQQALEVRPDEGDDFNSLSASAHILQVLMRIEPYVREDLPDLLTPVVQVRERILVSLPAETQRVLLSSDMTSNSSAVMTFAEQIEAAEKTIDSNKRYDLIVEAILTNSDRENLENVLTAVDKIDDLDFRTVLMEWVYFNRTKSALTGRRFGEAERFAAMVEEPIQRAFLHVEIARALLRETDMQTHTREILDESVREIQKSGTSIFAARVLLTISSLYAKVDPSRAVALLGEAIRHINRIDAPNFGLGDQTQVQQFKRRSNPGSFLVRFYMPGLDPEHAFSEMAKIDFDDTFYLVSNFTDLFTRALTTLAVADVCLQKQRQPFKGVPKKP